VVLFLGLFKIRKDTRIQTHKHPFVSVVVAARNEEENLAGCLRSLLSQVYPKELYEVILIDDNSTDNTLSIARSFAERYGRLKVLSAAEYNSLTGKQNALDTGIRASAGEIILTTDADCQVPPGWIEDIVGEFGPEVGLVAGFSILSEEDISSLRLKTQDSRHKTGKRSLPVLSLVSCVLRLAWGMLQRIFIKLQSLETLSLYIGSIGSIAQGFAWAGTGNNMAYRREVYDELGGFGALGVTGAEDSMLLQWVDRNSKWKVKPTLSTVYVKPMSTVSQYIAQRNRWASSALQNRLSLIAFMVIVYGLNLFLPFLVGLCAFSAISYKELILFLSLKTVPEFLVLLKGLALFKRMDLVKYFLLLQPFHVIYVLMCGIHGLSKGFVWKERRYSERKERDTRRKTQDTRYSKPVA
jgi:cellulose synthase/poly-beta-1,6-N-acetylglucosamine synthase-like glycosyltransferase